MNATNLGGWLQVLMGLVSLAGQAYGVFNGAHIDTGHAAVSAGLVAGGVAHLNNGRK